MYQLSISEQRLDICIGRLQLAIDDLALRDDLIDCLDHLEYARDLLIKTLTN